MSMESLEADPWFFVFAAVFWLLFIIILIISVKLGRKNKKY